MAAHESNTPKGNEPDAPAAAGLERALGAIWADQLGLPVERIGTHRSFFELGGNSLSIMGVQAALRTTMGREVAIADLFRHPTIHQLARYIEGAPGQQAAPDPGPGLRDARDRMLKARGLQHRS